MPGTTIQERLKWDVTPELYDQIRRLWIKHSIAEDKRDLPGLMETLAEDCVYEVFPLGRRWEGHVGATAFYTELITAFPDIKFNLADIVIGPQGVFEVAVATGTHKSAWSGAAPTNQRVNFRVIIHFPWNPAAQKFGGEKVYVDSNALSTPT